jgi:hypothetical protein
MDKSKIDKKTGKKNFLHDDHIYDLLIKHFKKFKIGNIEVLKNFLIYSRRQNLKRFLIHYDLFKKTIDIPGDILELGVYRGEGLMTWANLLEIFCIGNRTKRVFGFDNWSGFKSFSKFDGQTNKKAGKTIGGFNPKEFKNELIESIKIFDKDRFIPWKKRIFLIDGDIEKTIKQFVKKNSGIRFSLVHFDMDLYKPTKIALETIFPLVVKNGILIFDDYAMPDWAGETKAVDNFLKKNPNLKLQNSSISNVPGAWIIKT